MTKVYIRDISALFDGKWAEFLPLLPPERRAGAQKLKRDQDAARCVGAWLLLRDALAQEGADPDRLVPRTGKYGKPFIEGCPEFSISHAGPYAAAAVSEYPVGIDIEAARCTIALARHFFADAEVAAAEALSGEAQRLYLQRLWVAKEAFVKALGTGLGTPLASFCVRLQDAGAELSQDLTATPIYIAEYAVGEYRAAVAGSDPEIRLLPSH